MKTIADLEAELRWFDKISDEARVVREIRPPPLTKKRWKYTAGSLCRAASASIVSRYNDFDEISPSHCLPFRLRTNATL